MRPILSSMIKKKTIDKDDNCFGLKGFFFFFKWWIFYYACNGFFSYIQDYVAARLH